MALDVEEAATWHRHEASYSHPQITAGGVERGTCRCGLRVSRPVGEGVSPATNRSEWVAE